MNKILEKKFNKIDQKNITSALLLLHRKVVKDLKQEHIFKKVASTIRSFVKSDGCAILMIDNGKIDVVARYGFLKNLKKVKFSMSMKPIRYILKTGKSIISQNVSNSPFKSCIPEGCSMNSLICVPVKTNGKIISVILLDSKEKNAFTQEDVNFVKLIASELSSIIERSFLYSKIEQLSIKDQLTGCYNRRHIYFDIKKEIARCKRYSKNFSIIVMDFDNFKKFNDTFGHLKGDYLLKNMIEKIRKSLRKSDVIYRYGGDEFVLLLPETNKEGAMVCAKRLEEIVDKANKKIDKKTKITLSTGCAGYPEDGDTPSKLIKVADKNMYKNKLARKASR